MHLMLRSFDTSIFYVEHSNMKFLMIFILILEIFTFALINSNENQTCICKFPFIYKDQTYNTCTNEGFHKFWCATQVDETYQVLKWNVCGNSNDNQTCICKFPFIYKGQTYNACTKVDFYKFWCATQVDEKDHMPKIGGWGYCDFPMERGKVIQHQWFSEGKILLITSLTIFGFVVLITIGMIIHWHRQKKIQHENLDEPKISLFKTVSSSIDHIEKNVLNMDSKTLIIGNLIGSGNFGEVFNGIATGIQSESSTKVALKFLIGNEKKSAVFLKEITAISQLKHKNIVEFYGVCLDSNCIVMELMEGGQIHEYLITQSQNLNLYDLMDISHDILNGCVYLEEMKFVHRDLAARNCLLNSTDPNVTRIVKIGDFGLAKNLRSKEYYKGEGLLPVKWMAPESIMDGIFTIKSDVWSFGILMWEILTLGKRPYQEKDTTEVKEFVCHNFGHLEVPIICPQPLAILLKQCWSYRSEDRPKFEFLLKNIKELLKQKEEFKSKLCCHFDETISDAPNVYQYQWVHQNY